MPHEPTYEPLHEPTHETPPRMNQDLFPDQLGAAHSGLDQNRLGQLLVGLFHGVLYRDADSGAWQALSDLQARVRDYCATIGLELILDDAEGYAYVRQRVTAPGEPALPRLVQRRQLSYPVSLILVLLRKKLAEFDATGGETRLVVGRDQITEQVRLFLPQTGNEARLLDRMDTHLNKVVELGFLQRLRGACRFNLASSGPGDEGRALAGRLVGRLARRIGRVVGHDDGPRASR